MGRWFETAHFGVSRRYQVRKLESGTKTEREERVKRIKLLKGVWIVAAGLAVVAVTLTGCSKDKKTEAATDAAVEEPVAAPAAAEEAVAAPAAAEDAEAATPKDHPAH
jgi:hypothetical protein